MRSALAWVAIPVLAGAGIFSWQRSEIVRLRGQVARQGDVLAENQARLDDLSSVLRGTGQAGEALPAAPGDALRPDSPVAALRQGERRLILDQYSDVVARLDLPATTASRLQDLLVDRVDAVLDAQDAAVREGFAEGSSETARAVALAVAEVDQQIVSLVGPAGTRRLDGPADVAMPGPAVAPAPAAPVVVVNVGAPSPDYSGAGGQQPAAPDASGYYSPFLYYPVSFLPAPSRGAHPFGGARLEAGRLHRASPGRGGRR
ncbi:MAG TPA: hypothetical protein VGG34_03875 [Opitutaceae bacterium]|jgi:hypothetical protein